MDVGLIRTSNQTRRNISPVGNFDALEVFAALLQFIKLPLGHAGIQV